MGFALFLSWVPAGFPSPADDHLEGELDLNELLIQHPAATFFVRLAGDSMVNAGLFDGDILVVDRAEQATHGRIVVAVIDGEMTVKRLYSQSGRIELRPENPAYKPILFDQGRELVVCGVIIGSVIMFYRRCMPSSSHNLTENSASTAEPPIKSYLVRSLCGHPDGNDPAAKSKNDTKENQKNNNILKWATLFRYGFRGGSTISDGAVSGISA